MKAILKYPGSKWGKAEWIINFFPPHHSYLESYFGSGAVLFNKERSNIETVNDLDDNVVNLFEWIKQDPEKLASVQRHVKRLEPVRDHILHPIADNETGSDLVKL